MIQPVIIQIYTTFILIDTYNAVNIFFHYLEKITTILSIKLKDN